jgi:hypothetical protein
MRTRTLVVALLLMLGALVVPSAQALTPQQATAQAPTLVPSALPGYTCHRRFRSETVTIDYPQGIYRWYLRLGGRFCVCKKPGHRNYSTLTAVRAAYNREGGKMSCSWLNPVSLRKFRVNPRAYDRFGHQFNPPEFHLACHKDTTGVRWVRYEKRVRLYWDRGNTHAPRLHFWWGLDFNSALIGDPHDSLSIPMRGIPL